MGHATKTNRMKMKKPALEGNDACMLMHTALRKACDSKITSSVYNMIHLVDIKPEKYDPWRFLGKLVADRLNEGAEPVQALGMAHTEWERRFLDFWLEGRKRDSDQPSAPSDDARTWMYALSSAMHCFSDSDWKGMAAFLGDEP